VTTRIACVFAHPDDDTYGVGGTLALHAGSDLEITVVMTTSGEAGQISDPSLATRETLGAVREVEDRASWRALGLEPTIKFLRYPDGAVADVPREDLVAAYLELLLEARPDVLVTFGPDGITGHEDHVAVGLAATEAFHIARTQGGGGFLRLLHNVLSQSRLDRFNELLRARGMETLDPTQPFVPRGVSDARIGVSVDCSTVSDRKLEALRCHRSQSEMEDLPFDLWPAVLGHEDFEIAWPERDGADRPVLRDLFEGLPGL
jgi:N-acetyl-1-D-myo-inositol-2-amino-2-deoxy-alpha-D-glucopyranoside deacetylase